jgi:serine/threonine protein kinase
VWSRGGFVYVYDVAESLDRAHLLGTFSVGSTPTDITTTANPDLIYVACEDFSLSIRAGKPWDYPLRIPDAKLTNAELGFATVLLGPMTCTKSRSLFSEVTLYRFIATPVKLAAFEYTDRMTLIFAVYQNGDMGSVWVVNGTKPAKLREFDALEFTQLQSYHQLASSTFLDRVAGMQARRQLLLDMYSKVKEFDEIMSQSVLSNVFNPQAKPISISAQMLKLEIRSWFPFLLEAPVRSLSAYELFHLLRRADLLPSQLSTFAAFLNRYAPAESKRIPTDANPMPVNTRGIYQAITDVSFSTQQVGDIVTGLNAVTHLQGAADRFTIQEIKDARVEPLNAAKRLWYSAKELALKGLRERVAVLEDLVKIELMNRIQTGIDRDFRRQQNVKLLPIPDLNLAAHPQFSDYSRLTFTTSPNRNPLLDEQRHRSIYDMLSRFSMCGRDPMLQLNLRAWDLPSSVVSNSLVSAHLKFVRAVSSISGGVSSVLHSLGDGKGNTTRVVGTEDSRALSLSHYLTIHSFLGANMKSIQAARAILAQVLVHLYKLHKQGIIVRTLCPDNIMLNASERTVTLGNLYDAQHICKSGCVQLPLPAPFAKPSNPFLPPEYFHEPPRKFTTAFDMWQLGMTLLYIITGFLPVSYGSQLLSHIGASCRRPQELHVMMEQERTALDDPPLYPRYIFFYDWLENCPLAGPNDRPIGERGESFVLTSSPGVPASILHYEHYRILSFLCSKTTSDEFRVFLQIIVKCLQIDPQKRPTAEDLLKTAPFSQGAQSNEVLDQYMRKPNANVFLAQFFAPILSNLTDETFPFAMGLLNALLFRERLRDEDQTYAFPLDARANEKVVTAIFQLKFLDLIVAFVLKRIASRITAADVRPTMNYQDEMADILIRFFGRFITSVHQGVGPLVPYVDDLIQSVCSFYTANPCFRYSSATLLASPRDSYRLVTGVSALVYVFTYIKGRHLIKSVLEGSMFIRNSIAWTPDHTERFFDQLIPFSDSAFSLANAVSDSVERVRANAIKAISGIWGGGQSPIIVRLFIDFSIPQQVIQNCGIEAAQNDASSFIGSLHRAVGMKPTDPTMKLLGITASSPIVVLHGVHGIRRCLWGDESARMAGVELSRNVLFGGSSPASVYPLIVNDLLFLLIELGRETVFHNIVADMLSFGSPFGYHVTILCKGLVKLLKVFDIPYQHRVENRAIEEGPSLEESLPIVRRLETSLFRGRHFPAEMDRNLVGVASNFLIRSINLTLKECDGLAKRTQYEADSRNARAKDPIVVILDISEQLFILFASMCLYWRNNPPPGDLFELMRSLLVRDIPGGKNMAFVVHRLIHRMILHSITALSVVSPVHQVVVEFMPSQWIIALHRDLQFAMALIDKDNDRPRFIARYGPDATMRWKMHCALVKWREPVDLGAYFRFIVTEMLHVITEIKFPLPVGLVREWRFPFRFEAVKMLVHVIQFGKQHKEKLCEALTSGNLIENERKMTDARDDFMLVESSISLLSAIVNHPVGLEGLVRGAKTVLDGLQMRFERELTDIASFKTVQVETKPGPKQKGRESPERPVTALAIPDVKPAPAPKSARPSSAFARKRPWS